MPEDGHAHLRPCPTCHGHAYISAFRGTDEEVLNAVIGADHMERHRNAEGDSRGVSPQTQNRERN